MGCSASRAAAVAPSAADGDLASASPPRMRRRSGLAFRYSSESSSVREAVKEEEPKKEEPPPPPPLTGPCAYRLGKTLGSGGFSVVREAVRLRDGARFAAKVIPMPPDVADDGDGDAGRCCSSFPPTSPPSPEEKNKKGTDKKEKKEKDKDGAKDGSRAPPPPPSTRAEVEREVACLRSLPPHPNVVRLVDAFADPSQRAFVVVTELLRGGELLDALLSQDGGAYPETTAAAAAVQVAAALAHAHAHGVVHRDVKLDNVLLAEPGDLGSLKLADFGLSAALAPSVAAAAAPAVVGGDGDENEQQQQQQQPLFGLATVCGTPAYVAPEVLAAGRGGPRYDSAADNWSLGVLIFTLLGGYQPFWAENEAELFGLIRRGEFDNFDDEVWSGVSEEAKDLITNLLVVDPRRRLSAREALEHPWMVAAIEAGALAPGALPSKEEEVGEQRQQGPVVSAFAAAATAAAATTARASSSSSAAASRSLSSALPSMQPRVSSSDDSNALALRRAASLAQQARNARNGGGGGRGGPTAAAAATAQARQLSSPLPPLPPRRSSVPLPQPPVSAFAKAAGQQQGEKEVKVGASSSSKAAAE